jgi:agmatinase
MIVESLQRRGFVECRTGEDGAPLLRDCRNGDEYVLDEFAFDVCRGLADPTGSPADPGDPRVAAALERLRALGAVTGQSAADPTGTPFVAPRGARMLGLTSSPGAWPDAAFAGLPWDIGFGAKGAALGPEVVRSASQAYATPDGRPGWHSYLLDRDVLACSELADLGDLAAPAMADHAQIERVAADALGRLVEHGVLPALVGGDHSLTLTVLRALPFDELAVVVLDAHDDFYALPAAPLNHGTWLREATTAHTVASVLVAGVRGLVPKGRSRDLRAGRVMTLSADEWCREGFEHALEALPDIPVHLSIDIDVLDPAFAPGTSALRGGGVALGDVVALVRGLADRRRIVSVDLMEVGQPRVLGDYTALYAVEILVHALDAILAADSGKS